MLMQKCRHQLHSSLIRMESYSNSNKFLFSLIQIHPVSKKIVPNHFSLLTIWQFFETRCFVFLLFE